MRMQGGQAAHTLEIAHGGADTDLSRSGIQIQSTLHRRYHPCKTHSPTTACTRRKLCAFLCIQPLHELMENFTLPIRQGQPWMKQKQHERRNWCAHHASTLTALRFLTSSLCRAPFSGSERPSDTAKPSAWNSKRRLRTLPARPSTCAQASHHC